MHDLYIIRFELDSSKMFRTFLRAQAELSLGQEIKAQPKLPTQGLTEPRSFYYYNIMLRKKGNTLQVSP